jgi:hypothetical protein
MVPCPRCHFVRQCVHTLIHLGPKTFQKRPPCLSAQWTMEQTFEYFGVLLKQPSNPFVHYTELAKKVAEINALVSIWPALESEAKNPHGSIDIGNGFLLLGPKDEGPYGLFEVEQEAVRKFYSLLQDYDSVTPTSVYRWGRLRIPTEQVARSYWKEVDRSDGTARTDRNLKAPNLDVWFFDLR